MYLVSASHTSVVATFWPTQELHATHALVATAALSCRHGKPQSLGLPIHQYYHDSTEGLVDEPSRSEGNDSSSVPVFCPRRRCIHKIPLIRMHTQHSEGKQHLRVIAPMEKVANPATNSRTMAIIAEKQWPGDVDMLHNTRQHRPGLVGTEVNRVGKITWGNY
jgi:hypothetical protein